MNFPWIRIKVKHKVICIHLFAQRVKYTHLFVLNKIMLWFNAAVILFWPLEATTCFCLLLCVAFAFLWLETGKTRILEIRITIKDKISLDHLELYRKIIRMKIIRITNIINTTIITIKTSKNQIHLYDKISTAAPL